MDKNKNATDSQIPESKYLKGRLPLLWLTIAIFIVFSKSLSYDYIYFDDNRLIKENMFNLKKISYISHAFKEDVFNLNGHGMYYRPIFTITLILDAVAGNGKFGWFHFTNILLHVIASYLVFLLLLELGYRRKKSFIFSFIFALHPMITQAVVWVPGRNDTLFAVFLLPAVIYFIRYLKTNSVKYIFLHLLFLVLALLTKETAVIFIIVASFYSYFILQSSSKKYLLLYLVWIPIIVLWYIARKSAMCLNPEVSFPEIIRNIPGIFSYLGKIVFPFNLSVLPVMEDLYFSIAIGIIATLVLIYFTNKDKERRLNYLFLGAVWFVCFLVPSFLTKFTNDVVFSEHRAYIPLIGVLILLMEIKLPVKSDSSDKNFTSVLFIVLIILAVTTFAYSSTFKDKYTFWENAVKTSPSNAFNYTNIGSLYRQDEKYGLAENYLKEALKIHDNEYLVNTNLGYICMKTHREKEAQQYFLKEIKYNPACSDAYLFLGLLYMRSLKNPDSIAIECWNKAISVNPHNSDAYYELALYYTFKRNNEALEELKQKASKYFIDKQIFVTCEEKIRNFRKHGTLK
ncbi:MAG: hypothetical protein PHD97_04940 [Bacteroidales bacterium]|nr:hypothetical protein [Bacteroidales bacterium]